MKKIIISVLVVFIFFSGCAKKETQVSAEPERIQPQRKGYEIAFGDDFNPGLNFIDDFGISIVLVVDVSGSMSNRPESGGQPKYIQAAQALKTVSLYLESLAEKESDLKINVAVIKFSNGVETVLPMTSLRGDGIQKLKAVCVPENFSPKGGTAIGLALEKGSEMLAQSGTILNSMMIVTDGANTVAPEPDKVMKAIYSNSNNKSNEEITVRTSTQLLSFIGFDIDSNIFGVLHDLGARITSAADQTGLETSLKSLLEADITQLEGN